MCLVTNILRLSDAIWGVEQDDSALIKCDLYVPMLVPRALTARNNLASTDMHQENAMYPCPMTKVNLTCSAGCYDGAGVNGRKQTQNLEFYRFPEKKDFFLTFTPAPS